MSEQDMKGDRRKIGLLHRIMGSMGRLMPPDERGENPSAVRMFRRVQVLLDTLKGGPLWRGARCVFGGQWWPAMSGAYVVGDPVAPVAICCLTSNDLIGAFAGVQGVAITGRVYTPNLGIEKIIVNVTANASIRFLLLCGKESPVFHPAQALRALMSNGVTPERRIIAAEGHLPVLTNVPLPRIETFRRQVELVDCTGETELGVLSKRVRSLAERTPGRFAGAWDVRATKVVGVKDEGEGTGGQFVSIRPGGKREPLAYDAKGFFVITIDREAGDIVCRHYLPDNSPAHEMRGRSAEPMLLGLLREGVISELSHAGYLGGELAKAEAALRLGLRYEQDQPLRKETTHS